MISVFDRFETPPAAALLGWHLLDADQEAGTLRVRFDAKPDFCNPGGKIQGGILCAMLDDTMGPTIVVATDGKKIGQSIDLTMHFIKPVAPGMVTAIGRLDRLGSRVAYVSGELFDDRDRLCARATAAMMLTALKSPLAVREVRPSDHTSWHHPIARYAPSAFP